ncbi:MAG: hypothetical protein HP061_09540 [Christensenellaceae bacterium]|nr:hypothetical protein [Christensenellaceae bacterium]
MLAPISFWELGALMPLFLLFRKTPRSAQLFACKRAHNALLSLPTFFGFAVLRHIL